MKLELISLKIGKMNLKDRIDAFVGLGNYLKKNDEQLKALVTQTYQQNRWFTEENIYKAISAIIENFLHKEKIETWLAQYDISENQEFKTVGLILAGNIPLVGFYDLMCVFLAGHKSKIKLSEKDKILIPHFIKVMENSNPGVAKYFEVVERLEKFDAVIATGSNNSARYFEAYFGKYPNIIRRNRNAVAVLTGNESTTQLRALGNDVFRYFGLGCRNVSKLYLPKGFDFKPLLEAFHEFKEIVLHNKYKNNFDYNYTLLILNKIQYEANGCILMNEEESLQSRIAQLHYEYYLDELDLKKKLNAKMEEIQCIVSESNVAEINTIPFGEAQNPELGDYADGVDVIAFLSKLTAAENPIREN
jgi:hypothetical protein